MWQDKQSWNRKSRHTNKPRITNSKHKSQSRHTTSLETADAAHDNFTPHDSYLSSGCRPQLYANALSNLLALLGQQQPCSQILVSASEMIMAMAAAAAASLRTARALRMSQSTKSVLQSLSERGDLGLLGDGFRVWLMAAQLVRQCLCVCVC